MSFYCGTPCAFHIIIMDIPGLDPYSIIDEPAFIGFRLHIGVSKESKTRVGLSANIAHMSSLAENVNFTVPIAQVVECPIRE